MEVYDRFTIKWPRLCQLVTCWDKQVGPDFSSDMKILQKEKENHQTDNYTDPYQKKHK